MSRLLFEIGCEELPAAFCRWAERELRDRWGPTFEGHAADALVGPRRIALVVEGFEPEERGAEKRGPAETVAFADGQPTKAALGFARGLGLSVDELDFRDGYVWGRGRATPVGDRLWQIVAGLGAGKTMTWIPGVSKTGQIRFPRPIRWLCAKHGTETIEVGPGTIPSGGTSFGHRFPTATRVEIPDAATYEDVLREAGVVAASDERRRLILEGLDALGEWRDPGGVLGEVVYLVESPVVLEGRFDERFLDLPERVVETAMQAHQRYFPLGGSRFAFVANGGDPDVVRAGNERVLEGRLDDATFSWNRDVAHGIATMASELDRITFHAKAGSYADKTARLVALCEALGGGEATDAAARLAKADQAAVLVHEFPGLQGFVGSEYAQLAGYPEAVVVAVAEHYLPEQSGGPLPETAAGRVLAAADRVDNLTAAFAVGERPSGSRDPYGLRRAAIGLCRLATEGGLEIRIDDLVRRGLELLTEQDAEVTDDPSDVGPFVLERLEGLLDVPVEFVRAARHAPLGELGAVARLAVALAEAAESEHFERAYVAYDRSNSLAGRADGAAAVLDSSLANEPAEQALVDALGAAGPRIESCLAAGDYVGALEAAAEFGPPVDRFFDEIHVMAEDERIRANRLRLLLDVRDAVAALGDLSQIPR